MDKLIIQVALNEHVTRAQHPHVPLTPAEIAGDAVDCWNAGASIVHFHPRDAATGANLPSDVPLYLDALRRIRARTDLIFYPTYGGGPDVDAELAHVRALVTDPDGRLDLHMMGVGAWSLGSWDAAAGDIVKDKAYLVPHGAVTPFLGFARRHNVKMVMMAHELGHVRSILMLREKGLLPGVQVIQFNFSATQAFGPLPNAAGIRAYLDMLPPDLPVRWFVQAMGGMAHHQMNLLAIAMGGHPRIGIGDLAPEPGPPLTNAQMVARIVAQARAIGREVASPAEARALMGMAARPAGK